MKLIGHSNSSLLPSFNCLIHFYKRGIQSIIQTLFSAVNRLASSLVGCAKSATGSVWSVTRMCAPAPLSEFAVSATTDPLDDTAYCIFFILLPKTVCTFCTLLSENSSLLPGCLLLSREEGQGWLVNSTFCLFYVEINRSATDISTLAFYKAASSWGGRTGLAS